MIPFLIRWPEKAMRGGGGWGVDAGEAMHAAVIMCIMVSWMAAVVVVDGWDGQSS